MKAHRVFTIALVVGILATRALAGPPQTFKGAAAEAAHHFQTSEGHAYAMTFVRDVLKAAYDATQACKEFPRDAVHDIVFVVSSSGRLERTIAGSKTPYGRCLTGSLHLPDRVSRPPGDHWAVQLRFVNGSRKVENPDPPFIVLSPSP